VRFRHGSEIMIVPAVCMHVHFSRNQAKPHLLLLVFSCQPVYFTDVSRNHASRRVRLDSKSPAVSLLLLVVLKLSGNHAKHCVRFDFNSLPSVTAAVELLTGSQQPTLPGCVSANNRGGLAPF